MECDCAAQTKADHDFLLDLREQQLATVERVSGYWCRRLGLHNKLLSESREQSIRTFLNRLPEATLLDAVDIAFARRPPLHKDDGSTWKYFCGVCWTKIKYRNPGGQQ